MKVMKKSIFAGLILAGAALLFSVFPVFAEDPGTEPLTLVIEKRYNQEWDQNLGKYLCEYSWQMIHLAGETAEQYPELSSALENVNAYMEASQTEAYEGDLESARADAAEKGDSFMTYTDRYQFLPQRADSRVVSFVGNIDRYVGGVHGFQGYGSYNYDSRSGAELKLADVTGDVAALISLVDEALDEKYPDLDPGWRADFLAEDNAENLVWTLGYSGITFWFSDYDIAPYAYGRQNVTIPFDGNEALFSEMYCQAPESCAFSFPAWETASVDVDGDGRFENVYFWGNYSDYGYDRLYINIDGTETAVDMWVGGFDGTYVIKDGKAYLYIFGMAENDYDTLTVFDLSRKTAVLVSEMGFGRHFELIAEGRGGEQQLTNPLDFILDTRTDLLSTQTICRHFYAGNEGKPEPLAENEWYGFSWPRELTAKAEFTAVTVDENGEEGEPVTVPEGTVLSFYRTDDEDYVDMKLTDGSLARLYVVTESWPHTVDGKDIEELFEGVLFAG